MLLFKPTFKWNYKCWQMSCFPSRRLDDACNKWTNLAALVVLSRSLLSAPNQKKKTLPLVRLLCCTLQKVQKTWTAAHHRQGISMQQLLRGINVSLSQRLHRSIKNKLKHRCTWQQKREQEEVGDTALFSRLTVNSAAKGYAPVVRKTKQIKWSGFSLKPSDK